jgi:hypothetical protein
MALRQMVRVGAYQSARKRALCVARLIVFIIRYCVTKSLGSVVPPAVLGNEELCYTIILHQSFTSGQIGLWPIFPNEQYRTLVLEHV